MAEGLSIALVSWSIYFFLLTVQKIYRKVAWRDIFKNGDSWFIVNMAISLGIGIPLARNIASNFV